MHFAIRYLTEYRYDEPVTDNLNSLRVKPATTPHQRVDDFGVRVEPETRLHQHLDYYGTNVIEFGISKPHEQLAIDVRARVATTAPAPPAETGWEQAEDPAYAVQGGEYRLPFGDEPDNVTIDDLIGATRAATPADTLRAVAELIPERFEYRAGVTYVGSTVEDLLDAGAGVCQDFAHLALVLLRRHGLAARYVSGYLFAPAGDSADSAEVDTHAWIETLIPRRRRRRAGLDRGRPDQPRARGRAPRQDRPRPPLLRRAARQGRVPRRRDRRAGGVRAHDANRRAARHPRDLGSKVTSVVSFTL